MPHIHEKIDFSVDVYIVYRNKVLLRKHDKYKIWLVPGGHIELDENPNQAALREVAEEVGLDIELVGNPKMTSLPESADYKELIPPKFLNMHKINDVHRHVSFVYFAKAKDDVLKLSSEEVSEDCRWFTKEDLDDPSLDLKDNMKPYVKAYARAALDELGTSG